MKQLTAVAAFAAIVLGIGIDRASVANTLVDPFQKIRAQDEAVYVNSALGLAFDGGWLTPKVLGRYLLYKPPLLIWLSGLSLKIGGIGLSALRFPCLIAAVFATLAVFLCALRVGSKLAGAAAALLLLSNPLWHIFARLCYTDMLASAAISGAVICVLVDSRFSRLLSPIAFGALIAAGVMAKNIAGLIPASVLALYFVFAPRGARPSVRRCLLACMVFLLLAAPWHVYQLCVHGRWFFMDYVRLQILGFGLTPPVRSAETAFNFYGKRLLALDPALLLVAVTAIPAVWIALRRQRESALLLVCWIAVVVAALAIFQYRNLPYLLLLVPPLCLVGSLYSPLFSRRLWLPSSAALVLIFLAKVVAHGSTWGLSFGKTEPLSATYELRSYADQDRPNGLILIDSDDNFYAFALGLPRVQYVFFDREDVVRRYAPHYAELGITVTVDEFTRMGELAPLFRSRLVAWGLDSSEPLATAIVAQSEEEIPKIIRASPLSDYYLSERFQATLDPLVKTTHSAEPVRHGRFFLLARNAPTQIRRRRFHLPERW